MDTQQGRVTIDGEEAYPDLAAMDIVDVTDKGGNSIKFQMFEGKYYVPFYKPSIMQGIRSFDLRSDDIYFPAYQRTGSNWTFEMIRMLLNGNAETVRINKGNDLIECRTSVSFSVLSSPRVVCAHVRLSDAPEQLVEKKCKIVYKLRDPKDVAVSLYHLYKDLPFSHYHGEFKDFLYLFLEGKVDSNGYFGHVRDAEKFFDEHPDIPVHIQVYEETVKNPLTEVLKLSDFLGLTRNDDLCEAIAAKCEFSRLKVDKDDIAFKIDGRSVLYRKGIVGDWKNWFTDEMLEDYYRVYEEKMSGSRFYQRYARDQ